MLFEKKRNSVYYTPLILLLTPLSSVMQQQCSIWYRTQNYEYSYWYCCYCCSCFVEDEDSDMGSMQRRRGGLSGRIMQPGLGVYGPIPFNVRGERMILMMLIPGIYLQ